MSATYTYLIADLRSGTILDELPLSGVTFSKLLNDSGSLRGTLRVDDPQLRIREPRLLTEPGRTAIYVDRDGDLVWGGVIWTSRYASDRGTLELGAADFLSYLDHRLVLDPADFTKGVPFPNVDQIDIAKRVVQLTQSSPDEGLDLVFDGAESSGVRRTVSYAAGALKPVAEVLRDLANADNGFDFSVDVRYDENGNVERFLRFGYPRLAQPGEPYVWEYGGNLVSFTWPSDAASMANRVFGTGSGDLPGPPVLRQDAGARAAGWPLLDGAASQTDITDAAQLVAAVQGELDARRRPVVLPELIVRADLDPVAGAYSVGDDARIIIDDPFFAGDQLDTTMRILGFEVTPGDDAGLEQVKLTVAPFLEVS